MCPLAVLPLELIGEGVLRLRSLSIDVRVLLKAWLVDARIAEGDPENEFEDLWEFCGPLPDISEQCGRG